MKKIKKANVGSCLSCKYSTIWEDEGAPERKMCYCKRYPEQPNFYVDYISSDASGCGEYKNDREQV